MMMGSPTNMMGPPSMVGSMENMFMQMQANTTNTPGSYKCGVCAKEFRVPSRYESHMLSHAKGKPFCCDVSCVIYLQFRLVISLILNCYY
jgi:hypothetical protein